MRLFHASDGLTRPDMTMQRLTIPAFRPVPDLSMPRIQPDRSPPHRTAACLTAIHMTEPRQTALCLAVPYLTDPNLTDPNRTLSSPEPNPNPPIRRESDRTLQRRTWPKTTNPNRLKRARTIPFLKPPLLTRPRHDEPRHLAPHRRKTCQNMADLCRAHQNQSSSTSNFTTLNRPKEGRKSPRPINFPAAMIVLLRSD